ncbi:MAG: hypothetical protein JXR78_14095 [Victivallales bacterium]|nr:hypothetical protein [Victivallales bacterium]
MGKFIKSLEEIANQLAGGSRKHIWDNSIPSMVRREIALTVDQIKRLQDQHDKQFRRLLQVECAIDTDLMQLKQHDPWQPLYHPSEREKLKQRLFDIEKERRNLSLKLEEKTRSLEDKLLGLINKHDQLDV